MGPTDAIDRYLLLMGEFKERLIAAGLLCEALYLTPPAADKPKTRIDVENICLQLRKLLELIAMGSLVVNKTLFDKTAAEVAKMHKAAYILREIGRLNPLFFPRPVRDEAEGPDESGHYLLVPVEEAVLDDALFIKIYDKCGAVLHTPNPFGSQPDYRYYYDNLSLWLDCIFNTMHTHIVHLKDAQTAYVVQLNEPHRPLSYMTLERQ